MRDPEPRYQPVLQKLRKTPCETTTGPAACSTAGTRAGNLSGSPATGSGACCTLPAASCTVSSGSGNVAPGGAPARRWNWLGIVSVLPGILAFGILPLILGLSAILIGTAGLILYRKATGRIGISSIIGIVLGIAAIAVTIMLA